MPNADLSPTRELYRVEQLPVFQNRMFSSEQAARDCARGDVVLVQSLDTGLIHNHAFRPELMQYDANYQNEQGLSGVFREHLDAVEGIVTKHFGGQSLIEVGCGKGLFIERLSALGFDIAGFDPAYEGDNPRIAKRYFSSELGPRASGLVLRHVLEHIQDPLAFLAGILAANGGSGRIYIEVPCLDWIVEHKAWFDIFYEHVNYFRVADFTRMFGQVIEAGHCFGGQYLYVVADLATLRRPTYAPADAFDFPVDFMSAIDASRARLLSRGSVAAQALWGGASKGVIFALFMQRAGARIDTVVDINPAKQGRYLAATGIQVKSPEEALAGLPSGSDLYVMNGNYLAEIRALTANRYNYHLVEHQA